MVGVVRNMMVGWEAAMGRPISSSNRLPLQTIKRGGEATHLAMGQEQAAIGPLLPITGTPLLPHTNSREELTSTTTSSNNMGPHRLLAMEDNHLRLMGEEAMVMLCPLNPDPHLDQIVGEEGEGKSAFVK